MLVFCISSHGTYLADGSGDEPDRYDEALCPYDVADHPLADDELRERFDDLGPGVRLTVVADTCHSGSVSRDPEQPAVSGRVRFLGASSDGRSRSIGPAQPGAARCASCSSAAAATINTPTTPASDAATTER